MLHRFRFTKSICDSEISTAPMRLAVLSLVMAFLASTAAYAQAPAGQNRPALVPDGYVITPFGYFHPSCVLQLKDGENLLADGHVLQHADGTTENLATCAYPHYTAGGEFVAAGALPPAIGHSWIESADVTTTTSYGQLVATWTVPPAPSSNNDETVYMFPGLEDIDHVVSIIQPVLGWNADFSSAWGIASWNCCPNGITVESPAVSVSSGAEIKGTLRDACAAGTLSCTKWKVITEDVATGKSTTLNHTPSEGQTFNWAFGGALEVYNVSQCSDYPSNGALTLSVALFDDNFDKVSDPGWEITLWAQGLTPQCSYGGSISGPKITLDY